MKLTSVPTRHLQVDELISSIVRQNHQKPLGWGALDARGIGAEPGDLVVVAGRTSHGKTATLINLLVAWLERHGGEPFIMFSYELPPEQVFLRLLSIVARRHAYGEWSHLELKSRLADLQRAQAAGEGTADAEEVARLQAALDRTAEICGSLQIIYDPECDIDAIETRCRAMAVEGRALGGVFVDYLQLVRAPADVNGSVQMRVAAVARRLKALAVNLGSPVVTAAQIDSAMAKVQELLPRGSLDDQAVLEAIAKRRPQLHHLGQSAGEHEADLVLGLLNFQADYRSARGDLGEAPEADDLAAGAPYEVSVIKNRRGDLGTARLILEARNGYLRDPGVLGR